MPDDEVPLYIGHGESLNAIGPERPTVTLFAGSEAAQLPVVTCAIQEISVMSIENTSSPLGAAPSSFALVLTNNVWSPVDADAGLPFSPQVRPDVDRSVRGVLGNYLGGAGFMVVGRATGPPPISVFAGYSFGGNGLVTGAGGFIALCSTQRIRFDPPFILPSFVGLSVVTVDNFGGVPTTNSLYVDFYWREQRVSEPS